MTQRRNVDTSWLGPVLFVAEKSGARAHAMIKAMDKASAIFFGRAQKPESLVHSAPPRNI